MFNIAKIPLTCLIICNNYIPAPKCSLYRIFSLHGKHLLGRISHFLHLVSLKTIHRFAQFIMSFLWSIWKAIVKTFHSFYSLSSAFRFAKVHATFRRHFHTSIHVQQTCQRAWYIDTSVSIDLSPFPLQCVARTHFSNISQLWPRICASPLECGKVYSCPVECSSKYFLRSLTTSFLSILLKAAHSWPTVRSFLLAKIQSNRTLVGLKGFSGLKSL